MISQILAQRGFVPAGEQVSAIKPVRPDLVPADQASVGCHRPIGAQFTSQILLQGEVCGCPNLPPEAARGKHFPLVGPCV